MTSSAVRLSDSIYKLGPLGDPKVLCSYLIARSGEAAIIDCGPASVIDELLELAGSCGVKREEIRFLLLTHIHVDHAGGSSLLLEKCGAARLFVPRRGFRHLIDPSALNRSARAVLGDEIMDRWGECSPVPKERAVSVDENQIVDACGIKVKYVPAVGHAPHHNILLTESLGALFAADGLGIVDDKTGVQTPTTPPPSLNFEQSLRDIDMIRTLNANLICLAHFREIKPTEEFFLKTRSTYEKWARVVREYMQQLGVTEFNLKDYEKIFESLKVLDPSLSTLSGAMKQQVTRSDIGGLVDYFRKSLG